MTHSMPAVRSSVLWRPVRIAVAAGVAAVLVVLGLLIPLWAVAVVVVGFLLVASTVRSCRDASRRVDRILAEELGSER